MNSGRAHANSFPNILMCVTYRPIKEKIWNIYEHASPITFPACKWTNYRVYKKKLNRFEIGTISIQFLIYMASLGTYNVE